MTKDKVIEISDSETESSTGSTASTTSNAIRPSKHFNQTITNPTYKRRSSPPSPPPTRQKKPTKTLARVLPPPSPPKPFRAVATVIPSPPPSNANIMLPIPPRSTALQIHRNSGGSGSHQHHRHHPYLRQIDHPAQRTVDFLSPLEANLSAPVQVPRENPPSNERLVEWASSLTLGNGRRVPVELKLKLN
ncbi:unnamed protein product [Sphenostylis stenocarpa]|uniref:Uncharacterized protein n=1 Tax=Sphenostylis stenocarpa TaxID=92480 RepID=A0AA86VWB9_9FABA|nr:unnamed protein product [Sphenostylis stenocarpa]